MKFVVISLILLFTSSLFAQSEILQDFETDGCTLFIDGPSDNPNLWSHCCFEHDLRYWFGGTKENKNFADKELRSCVNDVAGAFWADVIYAGVKLGHLSPVKFKYVWGWAWEPTRKNTELTSDEIQYVIQRLYETDLDPQYREKFIAKYLKN